VSCLNPLEYALATAVPVAAGSQSWAPPDNGWAPIVFGALRLFAWAFAAVLLAGLTGLLRQQT
jgi:hypothetical protein